MASEALQRFQASVNVANRLLAADDGYNRVKGRTDFYHASWAAYIASWDSYLKSVCREYIVKSNVALTLGIPNTSVVAFHAVHTLALQLFDFRLDKFNTPNFDNAREFIISTTGCDTYAAWRWDARSLTNIRVKELLNEAVRVRHAFAHGFPVRNITQLASVDQTNAISYRKTLFVRSMIRHLTDTTDKMLDDRLTILFGRAF